MANLDEEIRRVHRIVADMEKWNWISKEEIAVFRKVIPPLPEPKRPRITPAKEIERQIKMNIGPWGINGVEEIGLRVAVHRRTEDVIALLEWDLYQCGPREFCDCDVCDYRRELLKELREADA